MAMTQQSLSFSALVLRTQALRRMDQSLDSAEISSGQPLFSLISPMRISFTERFPRTTIALISITLFALTVLTEIECLHFSGYFWR